MKLLPRSRFLGAAIIDKRQEATDPNQQQNATQLDIGSLNGTWYLTGVTQNVWDAYSMIQKTMNIDLTCLQFNVSQASNTSFDALISTFLTQNSSQVGVNASAASAFLLQEPDSSVNVTDNEYLWTAYGSQVFVNKGQWKNFTSNGESTEDPAESGSTAIPGTKPIEATIYSKLIDSNSEPGSGTAENIDTIFIWGSELKVHDVTNNKRADEVYGAILSKTPSVAEDVFNKTLALLPSQIVANNVTVLLLDDTCKTQNTTEGNNDQPQ